MKMNDLQLIEKLERHIGFVYHRLNCDGNWYAKAINPEQLQTAMDKILEAMFMMRISIVSYAAEHINDEVSLESNKMINSFDLEEYAHEKEFWE